MPKAKPKAKGEAKRAEAEPKVSRSSYTEELGDEICDRIAKGESLRTICADQEGGWLPSERTVYRWLEDTPAFRQQYARAREAQADTKFDQAWDIAKMATAENVQVARLQVDTIKWQAGKLAPKKYGEKLALTGGAPGDSPIQTVDLTEEFASVAREERDVIRKAVLKALGG